MKYKVTPRGWIVFSSLGILLIYVMFSLFQLLTPEDESKSNTMNDNNSILVSEDQSNIDDNNVDLIDIPESDEDVDDASDDTDVNDDTSDSDDVNNDSSEPSDESTGSSEEDASVSESEDKINVPLEQIDTFYFDKNVATFRDEHSSVLDNWILWLNADENLKITIEGHINGYPNYSDTDYGLSIANDRGMVIKNYLIEAGINEDRITLLNMGSRDQVTKSDDLSKHYLNRRAIIYFTKP